MRRNPILYKGLVVGVIVLFIGVGIQPAFGDVSYTTVSDSEDYCDLCPKVSKEHIDRIIDLIDRLEKYENQLEVLSNLNPKVKKEFQVFSEKITSLEIPSSNRSICEFLYDYF